ncbi:hypothetical protein [Litoreibacter meonggei]|nr:hypothetical protein [Litoreibacter meonggei]
MAMVRLAALSPLEVDPADIAVALSLPDGVTLPAGAAAIEMSAEQTELRKTSNERYVLGARPDTNGGTVYQLAKDDFQRFKQQQALISSWEEADSDATHGSFSVSLTGCRTEVGPQPDGVVTVSMRTASDGTFFPVIRNLPWSEVLSETNLSGLPTC